MKLFKNLDLDKLRAGLGKTRDKLFNSLSEIFKEKTRIDEQTLEKLEEILLSNDIGYSLTDQIIEKARINLKKEKDLSDKTIIEEIKKQLSEIFQVDLNNNNFNNSEKKPFVILIIGVNGVGKTTTIGKLAYNLKSTGARVIVAAADTFRAAAGEQLDIWAERVGADILQMKSGSDPSSVAFETVKKAVEENYDIVLIDTAGRLHNKANLMNELAKIKRAIGKVKPGAPHETFLILDAAVGQNALLQASEFSRYTDITGLIITKLDGTAKGGVVFQICHSQKIPVRYIGIGEKIDDLQPFDAETFVNAMFVDY